MSKALLRINDILIENNSMNELSKCIEENIPLTPDQKLHNYAQSLGAIETEKMQELRELISKEEDIGMLREKFGEYQMAGDEEIGKLEGESQIKRQIGLLVATAGLYYKLGLEEVFYDTLDDAITYAENAGLPEIVDNLQLFISDFER